MHKHVISVTPLAPPLLLLAVALFALALGSAPVAITVILIGIFGMIATARRPGAAPIDEAAGVEAPSRYYRCPNCGQTMYLDATGNQAYIRTIERLEE